MKDKIIDILIATLKYWQSMIRLIHDFFTSIYNFVSKLFGFNRRFYKYDEEMPPKKDKGSHRMGINGLNEKIELLKSQVLHFKGQSDRNFARYNRVKADSRKLSDKIKLLNDKISSLKKGNTTNINNSFNTIKRSDREVLRLAENYTQKELLNVYRRLRMKYHPDMHTHMTAMYIAESNNEFIRINKAYENLKDD